MYLLTHTIMLTSSASCLLGATIDNIVLPSYWLDTDVGVLPPSLSCSYFHKCFLLPARHPYWDFFYHYQSVTWSSYRHSLLWTREENLTAPKVWAYWTTRARKYPMVQAQRAWSRILVLNDLWMYLIVYVNKNILRQ